MQAVKVAALLLAAFAACGCDSGSIDGLSGGAGVAKKKKKTVASSETAGPGAATDPGTATAGPETHTGNIDNSGAGFQVKDTDLLRSSVSECMGPNMLGVTAEMIQVPPGTNVAPLTDAKIRFLLPVAYNVGDDIIAKEGGNMVDEAAGPRTNTVADALTDTYLRSLETIGNVVAGNCSLTNPNCQCATTDQARAMLSRCMPGLDPNTKQMDDAASLLGAICAINGSEGMRKAVASMIASYAFASAR